MARQLDSVVTITEAGAEMALGAAHADGQSFLPTGKETIVVANGSGGDRVVTIPTPLTQAGLAIADRTITIPTGETWHFQLPNVRLYKQADGLIYIDWDSETSTTFGIFRL